MPKLFTTYHIFIFRNITTLCWIKFTYHSYVGEIIGCGIFRYYSGSFGSLLGHFTCFFKQASGLPLVVRLVAPTFLICWASIAFAFVTHFQQNDCFFFSCGGTCQNQHFSFPIGIARYLNFTTPNYMFSCPPLWKPCGIVVSSFIRFFNGPPT
jgi:hypothetical protein